MTTTRQSQQLAPESPVAQLHLGYAGVRRLLHLGFVFALFATRGWLTRRSWFGRHTVPPPVWLQREGARLRDILVALGPTFIKIGQMLATRLELLPVEYLQALASLQDDVPPFPVDQARAIIAEELGASPDTLFARFNPIPVAAASLGQVYRAQLRTGREVAVKVQRPGMVAQITVDMAVLHYLARGLARWSTLLRGMDWQGMLEEFHTTLLIELDYEQEAEHAERFRRHFARWPDVYVPRIYHEFSSHRVLVMDYVTGFKVTDTTRLPAVGLDSHKIVKRLVRTYLKQLLEDGFFHADPHPGNLRVMLDGRLAFFDFGMVGQLPQELQARLLEAFLHLVARDVPGLVEDLGHLGLLTCSPEEATHVTPILEALIERYLHRHLGDIPLKALLFELAPVLMALPVRIPAHFTCILRALLTLEGIGQLVDPRFNLFTVARPYAVRYTFLREGRYWCGVLLTRLLSGEAGSIEWEKLEKLWKLAKLAFTHVLHGEPTRETAESSTGRRHG
jgi:predicted unusual protein kinase regulating ubiquinone biosynthesis (AarF/ABC1/UbiB family)